MARKNYTDEFRRQAVDLYRSSPGATLRGIAADLGISRHTLNEWVRAQTATAGTAGADATSSGASHPGRTGGPGRRRGLSPEDELAERIRVVHQRDPTQGVPRIAAELNVSRRLAGWAIAEHMRTELVADALTAARDTRGSLAGAVFHSDHSLSSTPRRTSRSSARAWG